MTHSQAAHERTDVGLCYVADGIAWFAPDWRNEWGDDWNDVPYEHNAGTPYGRSCDSHNTLVMLAYQRGSLETPAEIAGMNSTFSVETINAGAIPWLQGWVYGNDAKEYVTIAAGATPVEFVEVMTRAGSVVFTPVQVASRAEPAGRHG